MISRRTLLFLLGAIVATVPVIVDAREPKPIACMQAVASVAPAARPRLVLAQLEEEDQGGPCPVTPAKVLLKVLELAALGLWGCTIFSAASDVKQWKAARRRRRRRRASGSGGTGSSSSRPAVRVVDEEQV